MNGLFLFNFNEPSDALIVIIFTLFVASMVNERIIDFIKLHFPVLWLKTFNQTEEIRRHKKLWLIAFGMGVLTTGILGINFLTLISNESNQIGTNLKGLTDWIENEKNKNLVCVLGGLITALFISLGSKFWHDLLDLVLFVKNSKRKIENFNPEGVENITTINGYVKEDDRLVAQKALQANQKKLQDEYPGCSINIGYEFIDKEFRLCVAVMHRDTSGTEGLPEKESKSGWFAGKIKKITHITDYGYAYHFPVVEYFPGEVSIADEEGIAIAGGGLFNMDNDQNVGTFGCIVKDKKKDCKEYFLLTCYHCVRVPEVHSWMQFDFNLGKNEVKYTTPFQSAFIVGKIKAAYRDSRMDIAIIKPEKNESISDYRWFGNQTVPLGERKVDDTDAKKRTRIWFSGKKSGNSEGYIINYGFTVSINYKDGGQLHELNNLIVFSKNSGKPYERPCLPGDSGSIIIDADTKKALGMVVASDSQFGYAIPIMDILETNGLSLFNDPCEIISTN